MKKSLVIILILTIFRLQMGGQSIVDSLYFDMRVNFHQETEAGIYRSQFRGDHLNFHLRGHITPNLDYRIRQRLNKKVFDEKNMFNATDMLYLNWNITPKWNLLAGKYAVLIGGYEYDAAPIDVYFYSKFCNNIYQGFTFGLFTSYKVADNQSIGFQVCNSPLSLGDPSVYAYNVAWMGQFTPWWHTIWTLNYVEDHRKMPIGYISLGNHFTFGKAFLDIDIMNRSGFSQKRWLFSDMTLISKFIWSIGKWNLCAKAGYEWNDKDNVDKDNVAYDLVIAPGTEYVYAGCGVEFFPLTRDNVRLHAVYYRDNDERKNNIELGLTWKINVYKSRR